MKHGSLFSGIGGFDLSAEWMGWENMFHCEWNTFGQKVLKHYWPNAISYGDITKTDFNVWRGKIDVLTGGFPCQPFSQTGKRKGNKDDRHLWPQMLRAIREIQPAWVVGENVLGLLNWSKGLVFHEIQTDLEAAGYVCFPYVLPACGKDAPHIRNRTWILAHAINSGHRSVGNENKEKDCLQEVNREAVHAGLSDGTTSLATKKENAAHCNCKGLERRKNNASLKSSGANREEQFNRFFPSTWDDFPTQSPFFSRNDGLSPELAGITISKHRVESIKAYGNSIVPQIAYEIFKAIEEYEHLQKHPTGGF